MAITYKAIQTISVGAGGVSSIAFTSIPQTYTDFVIKHHLRCTQAATNRMNINVTFNAISANYNSVYVNGATGYVGSATNASGTAQCYIGEIGAATATASMFSSGEIYVPNYTSSITKLITVQNAAEDYVVNDVFLSFIAGRNTTSSAITSITIVNGAGNFAQYSTATIYGIKKF